VTAVFSKPIELILFTLAGVYQGVRQDFNLLELAILAALGLAIRYGFAGRLRLFSVCEAALGCAARRPRVAYAALGFAAVALRLALLPVLPIPKPVVADEFSHLLLADTLLHGRAANATHPMWPHFESLHIIQQPHYVSNYFPGHAAVLAAARLVTGKPWFGVVLLSGLCCAAVSWALAGWMPVRWALLGGVLALLRFAVASYWVDSYYGGFLPAIGGALVAGAYPRLRERGLRERGLRERRDIGLASVFGVGLAVLAYTRPYEGLFFSAPFVIALARRWLEWRLIVPVASLVGIALIGLGLYFDRVTGNPWRTTYSISQQTYGWPASIAWAKPSAVAHRNVELHRYYEYELEEHRKVDSVPHFFKYLVFRLQEYWRFFIGPALTIPLLFFARVWRSGRLRILIFGVAAALTAVLFEGAAIPHYLSPATAAVSAVIVECLRRLRAWKFHGLRSGLLLGRAVPVLMIVVLTVRIVAENAGLPFTQDLNYQSWCCKVRGNYAKYRAIAFLNAQPGQHLVLVAPKEHESNLFQWIYNDADIDGARIVWARDLSPAENARLLDYFRDRNVWRIDPNWDDPRPIREGITARAR
jgi:hypothetical protein